MNFKVGDKLYCHTTGRMKTSGELFAIKGEGYTISQIDGDGDIYINTLSSDNHYWGCLNDIHDIKDITEFFSLGGPLRIIKRIKKHEI